MADESEQGRDDAAASARVGALAAQDGQHYDTAVWEQGGYEASDWDAGPNYMPMAREEAPRRRSWVALAMVLATVALVTVGVLGLWRAFASKTTAMQVGSCVTATANGKQWTTQRVTCSESLAPSYLIVQRIEGDAQCSEPYSPMRYYDQSGTTVRRTYCLMENLAPGACYGTGDGLGLVGLACDDPKATSKVVTRADDIADPTRCQSGQTAVVFDEQPKRTYCLSKP